MSFWEHVEALRKVLLRIAVVMGVAMAGAFVAMPWLFDNVIMAPCDPSFPVYRFFDAIAPGSSGGDFRIDVVSIELASQIFVHLSASGWTALVAAFPIVLYLLWTFVAPALYEHERRGVARTFLWGNLMFYTGVALAYFVIFPLTLRFLGTYRLSGTIRPVVSLESYMDNFFTLLLLMGLVFELPVLAWLLGRLGVLTRRFFSSYRRHAVMVLLIVAALITPTGDPFTLAVVFVPIYALWEASARLVPPGNDEEPEQTVKKD